MKRLFFILFLFAGVYAQGQVFNKKKFENYGKLPLYFVIPESKDIQVKDHFSKLIETYWVDKNIKIVTSDEVKAATKNKESFLTAKFEGCQYAQTGVGSYGATTNRFAIEYKGDVILATLIEDEIGQVDVIYALRQAQFMIKNKSKFSKPMVWNESPKIYGKQLKEKTLLVPKACLGKMTEEEIKQVYPYKFEIVDDSALSEQVLSNSDNYLTINFGNYLWTDGKTSSFKILYSISDGAIVSYSMAKFSIGAFSAGHILKEKDFKNFVEETE